MKKDLEIKNAISYKTSLLISFTIFLYLIFMMYLFFFIEAVIPELMGETFQILLFLLITSGLIYKLGNTERGKKLINETFNDS